MELSKIKLSFFMKIGLAGFGLFIFGILYGWVLWPIMLEASMHKKIQLSEGTEVRQLWAKFPFFLEFKVWLFNITNAEDVVEGAKPIVQEVGPYFYEKWQEKVDIVDREEDDSVEYAIKNTFIFDPSKGLSGEEELIVPHVVMFAMAYTVARDKPVMTPFVGIAIDNLFHKPDSAFVKVKAKDILFGGLPIDCSQPDFVSGIVCDILKDADLKVETKDHYSFSYFGPGNATVSKKRQRVLRGIRNQMDIGKVIEYDGKTSMYKWNDESCDTFQGTDGTVFHPFFPETENVNIFTPEICRSMQAYYTGTKTEVAGIQTNRYTANFGDPEKHPEERCYCDRPDRCLGKGVMDTFKCTGAPIVVSHPHLYKAEEKYLQMVDGLHPSTEKHAMSLDFEPLVGAPLAAKGRVQINMMIYPVEQLKLFKRFPNALLPFIWFEEGITLPDYLIDKVSDGLRMVSIMDHLKWIFIYVGIGMCIFAIIKHYQEKKDSEKSSSSKIPPIMEISSIGNNYGARQ